MVIKGYCPAGLEGTHRPSDAFSRCEGASYAKCLMCTMIWMGESFSNKDYEEAHKLDKLLEQK